MICEFLIFDFHNSRVVDACALREDQYWQLAVVFYVACQSVNEHLFTVSAEIGNIVFYYLLWNCDPYFILKHMVTGVSKKSKKRSYILQSHTFTVRLSRLYRLQ